MYLARGPFPASIRLAVDQEWRLGWNDTLNKLFWFSTITKEECDFGKTPEGYDIHDVGDWCRMKDSGTNRYYWQNFRTDEISDTDECPKVAFGKYALHDGFLVSHNPYGVRRQNPTFDKRATRHFRQSNQHCAQEINDGPMTQKPRIEEESSNVMAEETKENRRIANRDKVRKCRERMDEVSTAVAKLENTLRKRLFRQKEKHTKIWFRCDDHLLPTTDKKLDHQTKENQKIANRDRVRKCRANMTDLQKAVAKMENTLRKRLFRQNEKQRRIPFLCDRPLPKSKPSEQTDEMKEKKKAKAAEEMRTYRSKLSTEKKDEVKKQNKKRKAEIIQLEKEWETSPERIIRLDCLAYNTRKSMCKKRAARGGKTLKEMASQKYYTDTHMYNTSWGTSKASKKKKTG